MLAFASPDGKLYWGQGTVTNMAVVGADNFAYEWLQYFPDWHDVPSQDITLVGRNYQYSNVLGDVTETFPGQVIEGSVKCNGSVLRCDPDGGNLGLVAWGLRNPYGTAFHSDPDPPSLSSPSKPTRLLAGLTSAATPPSASQVMRSWRCLAAARPSPRGR